ncbi:MAG TPA: hypothetical protein VFV50_12785 [Bdellovibrionales bacterium]|nr:hypothetical protein [Bdellovibrionales bacterium]
MKLVVAMLMVFGSVAAQADGFVCETLERDLNVKVYHHTQPSLGTRNAAVMVISDPAVQAGRKTIARFQDVNGVLSNEGARYTAKVDLRFADSSGAGELISGTKLGYLATIGLRVAHNFAQPVAVGQALGGSLTLTKRDGEIIRRQVVCARYLKN